MAAAIETQRNARLDARRVHLAHVHLLRSDCTPIANGLSTHLCSYSLGDKVERWLNDLLCLDAAEHTPPPPARLPHPGVFTPLI